MDVTCVSGGVTCCYLFVQWWCAEGFFFLPLSGRGSASRLRGSGLKKEVKLREGASRFEASERRRNSGDSAGRETGPGHDGSAFCDLEKRARAEGKAGKGLQEVCLPSAG